MERRQDKENLWIWIGAVPSLLFLFAGDPESIGFFFILAILTVMMATLLAFALLKIVLEGLSKQRLG